MTESQPVSFIFRAVNESCYHPKTTKNVLPIAAPYGKAKTTFYPEEPQSF